MAFFLMAQTHAKPGTWQKGVKGAYASSKPGEERRRRGRKKKGEGDT